jgi:FAD/FMN-containing dehydrogenase
MLTSKLGAVQWENWEARPRVNNQSCYIESPRAVPCSQGRVSLYSVTAESVQHIQESVRFARNHNLRIAIKNSGHDFLGRSSAPESLQILTHKLKDINITKDFLPGDYGNRMNETGGYGPAVTIGAGVQLRELYAAVGAKGLSVVAGFSNTVGAAGGYIQGGGHSPLGTWKGMASDNALEFKVVTSTVGLA